MKTFVLLKLYSSNKDLEEKKKLTKKLLEFVLKYKPPCNSSLKKN